ncbi:DUF3565 domain-containing protein [Oceanisphaera avium]|uniref:Pressure-regulated protein n=1 Tax=Oceanisphaera avium TaxID=1903694 RepID=A0A1Y0CWH3_9GAMM|nr:DUF3565 domain-containing protein [Oceanisphaera avium]ART79215.1 hypothetical protein CBP12_02850 [Oceanisphaera avium]
MHTLFARQRALRNKRLTKQPILAFYSSKGEQWRVELRCGHHQLLTHQPPFHQRPWLLSPALRHAMVGCWLPCKEC